jgi:hypothetical protein
MTSFVKRIEEQPAQARARVEQVQADAQQAYEGRKQRYQTFLKVLEDLGGVAAPRLEKLGVHCKFDATPTESARRQERGSQLSDSGRKGATAALGNSRHRRSQSRARL